MRQKDKFAVVVKEAINKNYPMRSAVDINKWIICGSFKIDDMNYSFHCDINAEVATARCMDSQSYPNHYFTIEYDWDKMKLKLIKYKEI